VTLASLVISVVAVFMSLVIAGFALWLQLSTYRATTTDLTSAIETIHTFRGDMKEMLGELRGMTETMAHAQATQFQSMLDAYVNRPAAVSEAAEKAAESASGIDEIEVRLDSILSRVTQGLGLDSLREDLGAVRSQLAEVSDLATVAARRVQEVQEPD
jgi:hypothetical protein